MGSAPIWSAATSRRFPTGRHVSEFQSADMSAHSKFWHCSGMDRSGLVFSRQSSIFHLPSSISHLPSPNFELSLAYLPLQAGADQSRPAVATRGIASAGNHKKGDGILAVKVSNHRRVGTHGNGILSMVEKPGGYVTTAHKDAGLPHPGRTFALIRIGVRGIKNNRAVRNLAGEILSSTHAPACEFDKRFQHLCPCRFQSLAPWCHQSPRREPRTR